MSVQQQRRAAVREAVDEVRGCLEHGATVQSLVAAKSVLMMLAEKRELFPRSDFPLPEEGQTDRMFRIHEDDDGGYALYINSGVAGQTSRPHDHGGSWAIVVAVEGNERHQVYQRVDDGTKAGFGELKLSGRIDVRPGSGITLTAAGIHSIHALDSAPLLHLHLYGKAIEKQIERIEYEPDSNECFVFSMEDYTAIEEAR